MIDGAELRYLHSRGWLDRGKLRQLDRRQKIRWSLELWKRERIRRKQSRRERNGWKSYRRLGLRLKF